MNKIAKKLRKLKDQLDKIEEKEDDILSQIDEAIEELEDSDKSKWKWINILFPSILVVVFGFIRLKRENSRAKVLEEIYD